MLNKFCPKKYNAILVSRLLLKTCNKKKMKKCLSQGCEMLKKSFEFLTSSSLERIDHESIYELIHDIINCEFLKRT